MYARRHRYCLQCYVPRWPNMTPKHLQMVGNITTPSSKITYLNGKSGTRYCRPAPNDTMSSSPPKKKSTGSSHHRDSRLHDGGGHERLHRPASTSLVVAPALRNHQRESGALPGRTTGCRRSLPDDSVARGNLESEGRSRERTTGGVDSSN